jgi:ribosome-associated heat shock protein Hsp15
MRLMAETVRLDKWLWAARFYKTRSMAAHAVALGRVTVNGEPAKAARDVHAGDRIAIQQPGQRQEVVVAALGTQRGSATVARALYRETAESIAARERARQQRRLAPEPAATLADGRPTKRDRRALADWQRWSASIDE